MKHTLRAILVFAVCANVHSQIQFEPPIEIPTITLTIQCADTEVGRSVERIFKNAISELSSVMLVETDSAVYSMEITAAVQEFSAQPVYAVAFLTKRNFHSAYFFSIADDVRKLSDTMPLTDHQRRIVNEFTNGKDLCTILTQGVSLTIVSYMKNTCRQIVADFKEHVLDRNWQDSRVRKYEMGR